MELFFRLYFFGIDGAPFKVQNWVVQGLWDIGRSPVKLDYKLGWSPKTGTFKKNKPPHTITIDKNNFRKNYPTESISITEKAILFSGDSFTFGDGVDDKNTFPSIFQSIKNNKVINGGVQAYGIDQMYLRSMDIIQNYKISDLFFCFIPDDINRCNYSTFHKIRKPYFIIEDDSTKLIQIDPKEFSDNLKYNYSLLHKIGGYSLVLHKILGVFFPKFWFYNIQTVKKKEHLRGKEISIQLINILKKKTLEGFGVFIILHDLNLAYHFSDKVAFIKEGKICAFGTPDEVFKEKILTEIYGLDVSFDNSTKKISYY